MKNVLSQEVLVIESIEISSFSLIWEFGRIANHISVVMVPSMIIVSLDSFLMVDSMDEDVVFSSVFFKLWKAFNVLGLMVETCSDNKSFISVFSSI